jgi:GDP-L-fucose synthase
MNVLITGANGFIGRSLRSSNLISKHNMIFTTRKDLNVLDKECIEKFIKDNSINVIIHTAVKGHPGDDSKYTLSENLSADLNILQMNNLVDRIIIFGSGAEYNRLTNIDQVNESDQIITPTDYYSLGKYTTSRAATLIDNVYNLRLFGCFGPLENDSRFIKNNINKVFNHCSISIQKDRYFDFFYIDDLIKLIDYYIESDSVYKEINCVYNKKYKLSDIANIIKTELRKKDPIILLNDKDGLDTSYTATANNINNLKSTSSYEINFKGLVQGIKEMITIKEINEKN